MPNHRVMRLTILFLSCLAAPKALSQASTYPPVDTAPHPAITPGQQAYVNGLRTVGRGIAQLKTGVSRVANAEGARDTMVLRQAGQRLSAICRAAAGFMASGRPSMRAGAYDPPIRQPAQTLRWRVDSLNAYLPECQRLAIRRTSQVKEELFKRLVAYEQALAEYRTALVTPPVDTTKAVVDSAKPPQR